MSALGISTFPSEAHGRFGKQAEALGLLLSADRETGPRQRSVVGWDTEPAVWRAGGLCGDPGSQVQGLPAMDIQAEV